MSDDQPDLATLAASTNPEERRRALSVLAASDQPSAVTLLRGFLKDPQPGLRAAAANALASRAALLTQPTMEALVAVVERDRDPEARRAALATLGHMLGIPTAPRRHVIRRVLRTALGDPVLRSIAQVALRQAEEQPEGALRESQRKASARRLLKGSGNTD